MFSKPSLWTPPDKLPFGKHPDEFQNDENKKIVHTIPRLCPDCTSTKCRPGHVLGTPFGWGRLNVRETVWMFKKFCSGRIPKFDLAKRTKIHTLDTLWITLPQTVSRQPPERAFSNPHVGWRSKDGASSTKGAKSSGCARMNSTTSLLNWTCLSPLPKSWSPKARKRQFLK